MYNFIGEDKMDIDITKLKSGLVDYIDVCEEYSFSKDELKDTDIIKLDGVVVDGAISKNSTDEYIIDVEVSGIMVLPCAVTLKPLDYKFSINIEGNLENLYEEMGKKYENGQKSIDILPIIWENILMEIPIRVVSDEAKVAQISGDGWELITDAED